MGAAVGVVAGVLGGGGAGGLLGGLMGGGGLLGGIGQLVSGFLGGGNAEGIGKALEGFSPANVINATANLFNSIMGNSAKDAVNTLHKEDGMPKFVRDEIVKVIDEALKKHFKQVDPEAQEALNGATKDDAMKEIKELTDKLLDKVREIMDKNRADETQEATSGERAGEKSAKGKKSAQSWFAAVAEALGKVYGLKTAEMVKLSNEVSNVADQQADLAKESQGVAHDDKAGTKKMDDKKAELAAIMTEKQTQLQAAGQEMKLISETVATLLKSIGEALSGMARKQ